MKTLPTWDDIDREFELLTAARLSRTVYKATKQLRADLAVFRQLGFPPPLAIRVLARSGVKAVWAKAGRAYDDGDVRFVWSRSGDPRGVGEADDVPDPILADYV